MLGINENCKIEQFIAKKNFYTYGDLTSGDKAIFTNNISKITLMYQITPNKINISPYKDDVREYPMINVFKVEVYKDEKIKRIAEIIMKSIPYPMLIVFEFEDKVQLWTAHQRINQNDESKNVLDEFVFTDWETDTSWFDVSEMNMTNFCALYSDMVDCISVHNAKCIVQTDELTGEQARELTNKLEEIENQIVALKSKMKKETQFNKRIEINIEIKKLEQEKGTVLSLGNRVI